MSRVVIRVGAGFALATVLVALLIGAFLAFVLNEVLPAATAIEFDGRRFTLGDLAPSTAAHWAVAVLVVLVIAAMVVVIVPLVMVLAVGVPLLLSFFGVLVGLLTVALVASPLLLLAWWWWTQQRRAPAKPAANGTTIGP